VMYSGDWREGGGHGGDLGKMQEGQQGRGEDVFFWFKFMLSSVVACFSRLKFDGPPKQVRDMCCLLVLDSVTSTPQWIRQPKPRVYL
jgi:hypothetical protein